MSSSTTQWVEYRCANDCRQEGCPGHKVRATFSRTSDTYRFEFDDTEALVFDENRWAAICKADAMLP
jgi:hypothetical protein